ncbi:MGH1-like glycoside hydrolase domain-containing protein [Lunatibacter salilacus]|uniref:MGH1-like glycoside hydrolase domain-containing protein n=1 Tax=Lunatibacter salilacus TaxID=2483804 RepID=UPI00131E55BF|nr:glycogen debranching protein [Lunatibacter salilacus]
MFNKEMENKDHYGILQDSVVQGPFTAKATSPTTISSTYKSGQYKNTHPSKDPKSWNLTQDISGYPGYSSDQLLIDALYNMSLEELVLNTESDGTFRTGALWEGVWTRDISYSILLSLAFLNPEVSKTSLRKKVKNGRIIQDTGTGGAYPVSTDRVVWAVAAWEIYLVTGDKAWLEEIFPIIQATLADDRYNAFDPETGLMKGESSFLDWREQSYPEWMQPADIYESESLGTNAVHYKAHLILSEIGKTLGDRELFENQENLADAIKKSINDYLWIAHRGYYGQYLYGRTHKSLSLRAEALGESLTVLFDVADGERQQIVVTNSPVVNFGIPSIFPQIPKIPSYHNNGIWPFVQAFWSLAAAKVGNEAALTQSLDAMFRAAGLFLSNKENFDAHTGDDEGTVKNSDRQLWSVAGNLGMVYKVFFGMEFSPDGLVFTPFVPEKYDGNKKISGFVYRNSMLDIELEGFGNEIKYVTLDGDVIMEAKIPGDLDGHHSLRIFLTSSSPTRQQFNLVENAFSPHTPIVDYHDLRLTWDKQESAHYYQILENGTPIQTTEESHWDIPDLASGEYQVLAVGENGYSSFASEPIFVTSSPLIEVDLSLFNDMVENVFQGYTGRGYINIKENVEVKFNVETLDPGTYALHVRYSNGNGPINTDNKCAMRTLYLEGKIIGTFVFPQRGLGNWEDWGKSNGLKVDLEKGSNSFTISFEPHNQNMDGEINESLLDSVHLVKIK